MKRLFVAIFCLFMVTTSYATDYFFTGDTTGTTGTFWSDSSYVVDTIYSGASAGNLDSGIVYISANSTGPHSISIIIYNLDSTFLDSTPHFTVSLTGRYSYVENFTNRAAITANTAYWVGIHAASEGGTDGGFRIYRGTVARTTSYKLAQPTVPATITGPSTTGWNQKAIGVWYSDAAEQQTGRRRKLLTGQ